MGDIIQFFAKNPRNLLLKLALLDDVLFINSDVVVNVSGQKIWSWGESLLSAIHVDLTQLHAVNREEGWNATGLP